MFLDIQWFYSFLRHSSDSPGLQNVGVNGSRGRALTSRQDTEAYVNSLGSHGNSIETSASYSPMFVAKDMTYSLKFSTNRKQSTLSTGGPMLTTCTKCGGIYTNPAICESHEVKCNGTNRLMCHICKRVYSQTCALKEHLRGKHGLGELLTCKFCGRSFKYKPKLYDHMCTGWSGRDKHT